LRVEVIVCQNLGVGPLSTLARMTRSIRQMVARAVVTGSMGGGWCGESVAERHKDSRKCSRI
jgi:hypothetical protein